MSTASSIFCAGVDELLFASIALKNSMNEEGYGRWKEPFEREYEMWHTALQMIEIRYDFYHHAITADDLYSAIGQRMRIERLTLAIYNCIVEATRVAEKLRTMPNEYLSKNYNEVRCRLHDIEPCPTMSIGMGFVPSSCELTHICTCAGVGDVPPYMHGCLGLSDLTLIRPYIEQKKHRVNKGQVSVT